ncbi:MAG: ankyrin repeat domain-containing protein [Gammaproteobacteria bacterium]|nr:ankyrin repeat domain-containing protein [Gammaproteobacteria bacterium]
MNQIDSASSTIGHLTASYGSPHTLCYVLDLVVTAGMDLTVYINQKDDVGFALIHDAVFNKNLDLFSRLIEHATKLGVDPQTVLAQKTGFGNTVLHFAAEHSRGDIIRYLLKEYPSLSKQCWLLDRFKKSPQDLAPAGMSPTPNDIRDSALIDATHRMIQRAPHPNDLLLLIEFNEEWGKVLPQIGDDTVQGLAENLRHTVEALINLCVPDELLNAAVQKGADLVSILEHLKLGASLRVTPTLLIRDEWQLLILGHVAYDYALLSPAFWQQEDNMNRTPAEYFAQA